MCCVRDGRVEWLAAEGKSFLDANGEPEKMTAVVRKITEQKISRGGADACLRP